MAVITNPCDSFAEVILFNSQKEAASALVFLKLLYDR